MTRRVTDPDDPRRCRATSADGGQCWNAAVDDQERCEAHGARNQTRNERSDYLVQQFESRVKLEAGAADEVKILKENLMRINAMIAAHANLVKDEASMLANAGAIADLTMKAEKVTVSLNKLSIASNLLLAKPALITWGQRIVHAVAKLVEEKYEGWEEDLMELSNTVATIIVEAENTEES
jgi:hypothetical protein